MVVPGRKPLLITIMCPMTPIVWMYWVGVIGVCLSITAETPPGPADGKGETTMKMMVTIIATKTLTMTMVMMTMSILVSSECAHQSGHRHLLAGQMGKLPEGEKGRTSPSRRVNTTAIPIPWMY